LTEIFLGIFSCFINLCLSVFVARAITKNMQVLVTRNVDLREEESEFLNTVGQIYLSLRNIK
jgi:hypothetical protein